MTNRSPTTRSAPEPPASAPPAQLLRDALVDALAELLALYLASQPRDWRRAAAGAAGALGWRLDRSLAADLVGSLSDDTLALIAAELYDRAGQLLYVGGDRVAHLDVDDPELRAAAGAELRAALARTRWP